MTRHLFRAAATLIVVLAGMLTNGFALHASTPSTALVPTAGSVTGTFVVPTVTGLSPSTGPAVGGTVVTITGTNFTGATAVVFGTTNAPSFIVNSDTSITATAPAFSLGLKFGFSEVFVTTPGGTGFGNGVNDQFGYTYTPVVSSISPATGPASGGTSVAITGTNLTATSAVKFGATNASSFVVNSLTSITAVAPAGTGTVDIIVTAPFDGTTSTTSAADRFTFIPAPAITAVSPNAGPLAGGTSVTITGTTFTGATAVKFGATSVASFTVVSATSITTTAPVGAVGIADVTVTTPNGTSAIIAADRFTYAAVPTVTAVSPSIGPTSGGTAVTITGANFVGSTAVKFGATAVAFAVASSTSITATAPAGAAGVADITVTTAGGTSATSAADQFTFVAAPTVTSRNPTAGPIAGGTLVTLTGTGFTGATAVTFGATPATSFTVVSATSITATAPGGAAATVDITVTAAAGLVSATSASDQFRYAPVPTVTSMTSSFGPPAGNAGMNVVGTGFTGATSLKFGATSMIVLVVDAQTISTNSPAGAAGTVADIIVTTPGGTSAAVPADVFTIPFPPTVTAISPASGPIAGGTVVTLTGTQFINSTAAVRFGSNLVRPTFVSSTTVTAIAPAGTGTVDVTYGADGGTSPTVAADLFTFVAGPTVTAVSPAIGPAAGGTSVTITGTNFTTATAVSFGATPATAFTIVSATSIVATAPAVVAATGDITVTTAGGKSATSAADQFVSTNAPIITSVSPSTGATAGGTPITITGVNFIGATAVTFGTTPAISFTVVSPTTITASSPTLPTGTFDITITNASGTSGITAADQIASAAPVPTMSEWFSLTLAMLLGGIGFVGLRRRSPTRG